ncbi:hypothetical protein PG995_000393, partial [Apiospora arundinis]
NGSPHRLPRVNLPRSPDFSDSHPHRAALEVTRTPLSEELTNVRPKQRRISHSSHGIRVCLRLPQCGVKKQKKRTANREERHSLKPASGCLGNLIGDPYWGTLPPAEGSPSEAQPINAPRTQASSSSAELPGIENTDLENQQGKDREKRFGISDPAIWAAIHRTLEQQRRLSSLLSSKQLDTETTYSPSIPSRTSSQRKVLRHFTRELEKYAIAAGAAGKLPVITPTESDSRPSIHTVKPLLPYRREFQAAGLAVTSEEQRGQRPAGDVEARFPLVGELDGQGDHRSTSSVYSNDTYIRFTPEDGISTTMIDPEQEKKEHIVQRRPLPWLKKREAAEEPSSPDSKSPNRIKLISNGKVQMGMKEMTVSDKTQVNGQHQPLLGRGGAQLPLIKKVSPTPPHELNPDHNQRSTKPMPAELDRSDEQNRPSRVLGLRPPGLKRENALASLPRVGAKDFIPEEEPNLHNGPTVAKKDHRNPPQAFKKRVLNSKAKSPAPELPRTWKHTISTTSSLERALNAVSGEKDENQRLESRPEQPKHAINSISRPRTRKPERGTISKRHPKHHHHPLLGIRDDGNGQDPQAMGNGTPLEHPPVELAGQVSPRVTSLGRPNNLLQGDQVPTHTDSEPKRSAVEEVLSDLDVFFDYDDSEINDRDVLRGLQIAVHAAADNTFDALVRHRTGLRIRRFLADLNSVEVLNDGKITKEQPAR